MKKEIILNGKSVCYEYTTKRVKNINLRIKPDGSIYVSSNDRVKESDIESFIISKKDFILNALEKFKGRTQPRPIQYFGEEELKETITSLCKKVYPYFEKRGVEYPVIKFRNMKSQWGNCYTKRAILTFSTNLMYAPFECVEYVVCHEFTHFIVQNHSDRFYMELSKICPRWKTLRKTLKNCEF